MEGANSPANQPPPGLFVFFFFFHASIGLYEQDGNPRESRTRMFYNGTEVDPKRNDSSKDLDSCRRVVPSARSMANAELPNGALERLRLIGVTSAPHA